MPSNILKTVARWLYVKENIPSKLEKTYCFSEENEVIALGFSIPNKTWLPLGIHKPPAQNDLSFLNTIKIL